MENEIPPGFKLRHSLTGHKDTINFIAWSPNGRFLASPDDKGTIHLWDVTTGELLQILKGHKHAVVSLAWAPDGNLLASGSRDHTIRLWNPQTGQTVGILEGHHGPVFNVAWYPEGNILASSSFDCTVCLWDTRIGQIIRTLVGHSASALGLAWAPDGTVLASGSLDHTIRLWNPQTGQIIHTLMGHSGAIPSIAWAPDGTVLASGSLDHTIQVWKPETGQQVRILESHFGYVTCVSFSNDGLFLASRSLDDTILVWDTNIWEPVTALKERVSIYPGLGLAFSPSAPVVATIGKADRVIHVWDLDINTLLATSGVLPFHYINAKVVLVGDSGVGKSGLSLALTQRPFAPTESTHGRHVWVLDSQEFRLKNERFEAREILLWDLAGQPDYRLIHQLHLNEVVIALIVFDPSKENDPFAGVRYWNYALKLAWRNTKLPVEKFLVAARIDRGGRSVSKSRIDVLVQELGFAGYFETSAKEGWNIIELAKAIQDAIDWEMLPRVTSTNLFRQIKTFLLEEKYAGRIITTISELCQRFLQSEDTFSKTEELYLQCETCIGRVEASGLIRRLNFGNVVLLQPELLDAYASALLIAVKNQPNGSASIDEEQVKKGEFQIPREERLEDKAQEQLLLIAVIEEILHQEIALREQGKLIFPSQFTREHPDLLDPEGKEITFSFGGSVLSIYTRLVVRLSNSSIFERKELWRNAATYETKDGGSYGIFLNITEEVSGKLTLFFDAVSRRSMRIHFEEYIRAHLQRYAVPDSIKRSRIFVCPECATHIDDEQVTNRQKRGFTWIRCSVCETEISLREDEAEAVKVAISSSVIAEIDKVADKKRDHEAAKVTLQGKILTKDFDVFLCYNAPDKDQVKAIAKLLEERGILPWFDEWELPPGQPWQPLLEKQIEKIKSVAVFVGNRGIGPWQKHEMYAFLSEFADRGCPVIPVLLEGPMPRKTKLPVFLRAMTWVDFREPDPDPIAQLIWGITGHKGRKWQE